MTNILSNSINKAWLTVLAIYFESKIHFGLSFSDSFLQKHYTSRPALIYPLANDCLTLFMLLERKKREKGSSDKFWEGARLGLQWHYAGDP